MATYFILMEINVVPWGQLERSFRISVLYTNTAKTELEKKDDYVGEEEEEIDGYKKNIDLLL